MICTSAPWCSARTEVDRIVGSCVWTHPPTLWWEVVRTLSYAIHNQQGTGRGTPAAHRAPWCSFSHASIEQRPSVPASSVRPASSVKLSHTIDEFTERCQITVICTVCVQTIAHVTASAKAGCRGPTLPDHREYSYRVALSDPLEGSGPAPGPAPLLLVLATADGDGSRAVSGLAFDSVSTAAPRTESESGADCGEC